MTRSKLWIINFALAAALIVAAWWAMNAARVADPAPSAFGAVDLPTERPPVPPAPYRRAPIERGDGVGRRDVFAATPIAFSSEAAARLDAPSAVGVLAPVAAAPRRDSDGETRPPRPEDAFTFALDAAEPQTEQFFGETLIPPSQRASDRIGVLTAGEPGNAPIFAARPRINPRRSISEAPSTEDPASPNEESVLAANAIDGLILLGVFRSNGEDRALVRTPNGTVRVKRGDEIEGWRIATIRDESIDLRRASETRTLRLP